MSGRIEYYFWKCPTKRQVASGLPFLDDADLGLLKRFEWMVTRNTPGMEGRGYAYSPDGKKMSPKAVLLELARMDSTRIKSVKERLRHLAEVDEVVIESSGLPRLKHFERDCDRAPTNKADRKTYNNDLKLLPVARKALAEYSRIAVSRTREELTQRLGGLMVPNRQVKVATRLVDILEQIGDIEFDENDVLSLSGSILRPPPPASSRPPSEGSVVAEDDSSPFLAEGEKVPQNLRTTEDSDANASPTEAGNAKALPSVAKEHPPKPPAGDSGTGAQKKGGRDDAGGGGLPKVKYKHKGSKVVQYDRTWAGTQYKGWLSGSSPHPRLTKDELTHFKIEGLPCADLIDAMLYLAPDGTPPGGEVYPYGQEGTFKGILGDINKAAGDANRADPFVRQVLAEFIDIRLREKRPKRSDAAFLMDMLQAFEKELLKANAKTG